MILVYAYIFLVGIIIGSFLNVCIYRIPAHDSIVIGPSHCMTCQHRLSWYDLFPLFSWLFLRGKCRYCGAKISSRYPCIESLTGVMFLLAFIKYPLFDKDFNFSSQNLICALIHCAFFAVLIVVSMIDFDTHEIPDRFHFIILGLGLVEFFATDVFSWHDRLLGLGIISIPLCMIAWLTGGIGEGDVKLAAVAGFLVGPKAIIFGFLAGAIIASVYGIIYKARKKESEIPFGPFVSIGVVLGIMFADPVVNWYMTLFSMD